LSLCKYCYTSWKQKTSIPR